jgi:large subunit ribosomal protein L25
LKLGEDGKGKSVSVITYNIQRNPLTDEIIHLDFMNVIMDEAIKTKVRLELIGEPIGVKESEGVLVHGLREIEVKCLPGDIPDKFQIDVGALEINHSLHVSDLKVSKKVEILAPPEEMIAVVSPPTKEEEVVPPPPTPEELAAAEAAPAVAEEEVKEKTPPGAAPPEKPGAGPAPMEKKEKK